MEMLYSNTFNEDENHKECHKPKNIPLGRVATLDLLQKYWLCQSFPQNMKEIKNDNFQTHRSVSDDLSVTSF